VDLAKHHFPFLAMHRAPSADAAFERSTNTRGEFRVAPSKFVEYRHRPDARCRLEQRDDLGFEYIGKRIGTPSLARRLLLGRQPGVVLETVSGSDADCRLRCRYRSVLESLSFMNNLI
jgi:hypothetical protein